jgi:hypothetical protein
MPPPSAAVAELLRELTLFISTLRSHRRRRRRDDGEEEAAVRRWLSSFTPAHVSALFHEFSASPQWALLKPVLTFDLITAAHSVAHGCPLWLVFDVAAPSMALVGDSKGAPKQLEYLALERRTTDPRRVLRADRELLRGVFTSFKVDDYRGEDLAANAAWDGAHLLQMLDALSGGSCFHRRPAPYRGQQPAAGGGATAATAATAAPWLLLAPRFTAGQYVAAALEVALWARFDAGRTVSADACTAPPMPPTPCR